MRELIGHVDRLLRGHYTRREDLAEGRVTVQSRTLVVAGLLLGGIYGAFMGMYAAIRPTNQSWEQLAATVVKVPLLLLLTLVVTFPSLYVFSALANSRLRGAETLRLLLAAVTVNLALLASFGPVTAFFTLCTDSYPFLILLNTVFFAIAGFAGLAFLRRAVVPLFEAPREPPPPETPTYGEGEIPSHIRATPRRSAPTTDAGAAVFRIWIVTYAVVGAQMAWILRPFIGSPDLPFTLFRHRESHFFEALWRALHRLF